MKIVGREDEISRLGKYFDSGRPEFIALYGRRRVGKTFLVEQMFGTKTAFSVTGIIEGTRDDEMTVFVNALVKAGYDGKVPNTWYEAFAALRLTMEKRIRKGNRCIIFIDELPCFDTPKSRFVKAFGDFWNDWCLCHEEVMLIVCGSATTWMIKNIIDSHGGLHNRMTHEVHLHPFTLAETEKYLKSSGVMWDRLSILQLYSILGGVPYYLSLVQDDESLSETIDRLFYFKDGELRNEYERLFKSLYRSPEPYVRIMDILCRKKTGLTRDEISYALKSADNGHLSEYLDNLEKCDFIRLYHVKDSKGKKLKKTGGIYQVMDFFTIFHHSFLTNPTTDQHFWSNHIGTPVINTWYGLAFERVCMNHVEQLKKALGISNIGVEYYSWRSAESAPAAQIDLVIERADRVIDICEMKYSESEYTIAKAEDLRIRNRVGAFRAETGTRCSVFPILVTTYGLIQNQYSNNMKKVIVMDDLFDL